MLRFGLVRLFAVLMFGIAIPYGLYQASRAVGARLLIAGAGAAGLAYGAIKADHPWQGDGLGANLSLMVTSAALLAAYVALSVSAARAIARRL